MDIIIRSQDKTRVVEVKRWYYVQRPICSSQDKAEHFVVCDECFELGKYATPERCVNIVNDIYSQVKHAAQNHDSVVIYSMPKE